MNLDYADYKDLIVVLEKAKVQKLKSRGESHITVVTPPEFVALSKRVSIQDINTIALDSDIQQSPFEKICVGERAKRRLKLTFLL